MKESVAYTKRPYLIKTFYSDCCAAPTKEDEMRGYPICSKCKTVCGYLNYKDKSRIWFEKSVFNTLLKK